MQVSGIFSLGYDDCGGYRHKKKRHYGGHYKKYSHYKYYNGYNRKHYYKDYDDDDGLLGIDIDF